VAAARAALASWLGPAGDAASITTQSVDRVDWPDGCLGIGRAGRVCTQALVSGFRIDLGLGDVTFEVRTDLTGAVVLWAPTVMLLTFFDSTSSNFVHLKTDDGNDLDVQAVPGSDFGVQTSELTPGDLVSVGLANSPQGEGGLLLVWLDPVSD
jgi:hypothetical protein